MKKLLAIVLVVALAVTAVFAEDPAPADPKPANQSAVMKYEVQAQYLPAFLIAVLGDPDMKAVGSDKESAQDAGSNEDLIAAGTATLFDLIDKTLFNYSTAKSFTLKVSADGWKREGSGTSVAAVNMSFVDAVASVPHTTVAINPTKSDEITITYKENNAIDRRAEKAGVKLASLKAVWNASAQALVGMYYTNVSVNVVTN